MEFDVGKWLARSLFEPGHYFELSNYVESNSQLKAHLESKTVMSYEGRQKISDLESQTKDLITVGLKLSVLSALNTLSRHMIVLSVTLIEGMIQEYAECLFNRHPLRMYDYLEINGSKGSLSLKMVIECESKDQVIFEIAKVASSKVLEGKFESCLNRIENISKLSLDQDCKDKLLKLVETRNNIIHEAHYPDIEKHEVKLAFDTMHDFLIWLGKAALKNEIPIDDPANIIQ